MLKISNNNIYENTKQLAVKFADEHNITNFSLQQLEAAVHNLGYEIVSVSSDECDEEGSLLVDSVQKCFLFNSDKVRAVYIVDTLSDEVKCFCLARIIALILLDIEDSRNISSKEELFSISFAVHLSDCFVQCKSTSSFQRLVAKFGCYTSAALIAILSVITVFVYVVVGKGFENPLDKVEYSEDSVYIKAKSDDQTDDLQGDNVADLAFGEHDSDVVSVNNAFPVDAVVSTEDDSADYAEYNSSDDNSAGADMEDSDNDVDSELTYYVTKSGKKYHVESCHYVSDKSKCTALSLDEISSSKYEPCKKCIK